MRMTHRGLLFVTVSTGVLLFTALLGAEDERSVSAIGSDPWTSVAKSTTYAKTDAGRTSETAQHYSRAIDACHDGNFAVAIMECMRTIDLDPECHEVLYGSGLCYYRWGKYAHAIMDLERYLRDDPKGQYTVQARSLIEKAKKSKDEQQPKTVQDTTKPAREVKP